MNIYYLFSLQNVISLNYQRTKCLRSNHASEVFYYYYYDKPYYNFILLPLMVLFFVYSNAKKPSCFYPIPQAADCITRVVERANAPIIYLSTDAAESETGLLQSLVLRNNKPVPLVKRPARNSAEKWDALLYRHNIEGDSQVR